MAVAPGAVAITLRKGAVVNVVRLIVTLHTSGLAGLSGPPCPSLTLEEDGLTTCANKLPIAFRLGHMLRPAVPRIPILMPGRRPPPQVLPPKGPCLRTVRPLIWTASGRSGGRGWTRTRFQCASPLHSFLGSSFRKDKS